MVLKKLMNWAGQAKDYIQDGLFGITDIEEIPLQQNPQSPSQKRIRKNVMFSAGKDKTKLENDGPNIIYDFSDYDNKRNKAYKVLRKGPLEFPEDHLEFEHLSSFAVLQEYNDTFVEFSDNDMEDGNIFPSSKMLISYFARLGTGEDDEATINLNFIQNLIDAGANINQEDAYGQTLFFSIVRDWNTDVAEYALTEGAHINHADHYGRTALHVAASINYKEMVAFLIKKGAKVHAKTRGEEQTPLHYAAKYNAADVIEILISNGAVDGLDFLNRTPFHLAVEHGCEKSSEIFLKLGVPAGEYDISNQSVMALIVDRLPNLGYQCLDQFMTTDDSAYSAFFLAHLEGNIKGSSVRGQTVLQCIVKNNNEELIMHPTIQKLLKIKLDLFGRTHVIMSNLLNIFYVLLATVFIFSVPYDSFDKQFVPFETHVWKICVGVVFCFLSIVYIWRDIKLLLILNKEDEEYKKDMLRVYKKMEQYCHPAWKTESEFVDREKKRLEESRKSFFYDGWQCYELVVTFTSFAIIVMYLVNVLTPNKTLFTVFKYLASVNLLLLWMRLYKTMRLSKIFSEVEMLLVHILKTVAKIGTLYLVLLVPYTFVVYMLFGGSGDEDVRITKTTKEYEVAQIIYDLYHSAVVTHHEINEVANQIFRGFYLLMFAIINFVFIGVMTEQFVRTYKKALAKVHLGVANALINIELRSSHDKRKGYRKFIREKCNPYLEEVFGKERHYREDRNDKYINISVGSVSELSEKLSDYLDDADFLNQPQRSCDIDCLQSLQVELERLSADMNYGKAGLQLKSKEVLAKANKSAEIIKAGCDPRHLAKGKHLSKPKQ
eukprot:TCONS_00001333-protein